MAIGHVTSAAATPESASATPRSMASITPAAFAASGWPAVSTKVACRGTIGSLVGNVAAALAGVVSANGTCHPRLARAGGEQVGIAEQIEGGQCHLLSQQPGGDRRFRDRSRRDPRPTWRAGADRRRDASAASASALDDLGLLAQLGGVFLAEVLGSLVAAHLRSGTSAWRRGRRKPRATSRCR